MSSDLMSQFYSALNLPVLEKVIELTKILDQAGPSKDFQALFPQLVNNIFASPNNNGWGLRQITCEHNRYEFEALMSFLEPHGPLFRMCYKLLFDPQLKYNLPLSMLPFELQMMLERGGRCPQFYSDMLTLDSNSLNVVALALNPFDYYIFNFALHLTNNNQNKSSWEIWNSVYFALACDYLTHFLPTDPNICVLPMIPHYNGKVPLVAPLQSVNRPLGSPSLLLVPDLSGISNQHPSSQNQSRNEIWRSETVLQVFIDIWMSVEQFNSRNIEMYQRNYPATFSSPERVRLVRVVIKHIYSYSAKYNSDPAVRSSALRKYAKQIMCTRAYQYVKHLVSTWPLDASFRLVMELWLSLIQPWRYTNNNVSRDRHNINQDEGASANLDPSYIQFIAENYPTYTYILQLVLPRFMRLDLSTYKNAVMLFRLGKVFSQQHLMPILLNLEKAITDSISGLYTPETSFNNSNLDQSYTYNGISLHKWVSIAKQAISELNMMTTFEYDPIWSENKKPLYIELVKKMISAKQVSEKFMEEYRSRYHQQNNGFWGSIKQWFMINNNDEDRMILEESEKVPVYLNHCINYFSNIFMVNDNMLLLAEANEVDNSLEHSSFANSNNFSFSIAQKLRSKPTGLHYMGDPDLMPIMSYENTILVRLLYQLATKLNELYSEEFTSLWNRQDFWGYAAREILQKPITIQNYMKDVTNHQNNIVSKDLPPRLSFRRFGSNIFVVWLTIGYIFFRLLSYNGLFYVFFLIMMVLMIVLAKASLKMCKIIKS
ncbi:sphingomyelin phosphodiesterase 4 [Colias croceus]|uniref:sphingomyelin phosphodiesterase 4 n=1 Tax=Colias crocea TaxID=72248 RepID=UPI001E2809A0|nr:sphingomyelin phosphodiesterase 4 [Colias croceus]